MLITGLVMVNFRLKNRSIVLFGLLYGMMQCYDSENRRIKLSKNCVAPPAQKKKKLFWFDTPMIVIVIFTVYYKCRVVHMLKQILSSFKNDFPKTLLYKFSKRLY